MGQIKEPAPQSAPPPTAPAAAVHTKTVSATLNGKPLETIDPITEEVITRVAGEKEDIDLAVKAARQAFDHGPWPRLPGTEARRNIMLKFADLIMENVEEIALLDTIDAGKLFELGKIRDIPAAADLIHYYAGVADKIHGTTYKMST